MDTAPSNGEGAAIARMEYTMELTSRITINPEQCGRRPCVRGMRIRVSDVLDLMAAGLSVAEVVAELPDLDPDDVYACLRYAAQQLRR